jgi:hypothetical protein
MSKRNDREHKEQVALFEWAAYQSGKFKGLELLFAVPNGANTSPRAGAYMKAEGLKSGVPDLVLPIPRGGFHGLFIEFKPTHTPGVTHKTYPSKSQKRWLRVLSEQGYKAELCYGFEEAKKTIMDYLSK